MYFNTNVINIRAATARRNQPYPNFPFTMELLTGGDAAGVTVTGQRRLDGVTFEAVSGTITEPSSALFEFDALANDTDGETVTWLFSAPGCKNTVVSFNTSD